MSKYKNATCKGSLEFGTACGHCEKCKDEIKSMNKSNELPVRKKIDYNKYIKEQHSRIREKGFYDDLTIPLEDRFFMIQTEISKCGEAWLRDNWTKKGHLEYYLKHNHQSDFDGYIENTVQDKSADLMIRLFDIAGFLGVVIDKDYPVAFILEKTFLSNLSMLKRMVFRLLDKIKNNCANEWVAFYFWEIFEHIRFFSECNGIDLFQHIDMKMEYDKTSPCMHGKRC